VQLPQWGRLPAAARPPFAGPAAPGRPGQSQADKKNPV
jgi:hypothetical protein